MQDILVKQVPDERIDQQRDDDRKRDLPEARRKKERTGSAGRRDDEVRDDRIMLEIGRNQFAERHPVAVVRPLPERQSALICSGLRHFCFPVVGRAAPMAPPLPELESQRQKRNFAAAMGR